VGCPRLNASSVVHRRLESRAGVSPALTMCLLPHLHPDRSLSYGDKSTCLQQLGSS